MANTNIVFDALIYLAHEQLNDGLFEEAAETFSAAHLLDANDERAPRGRGLADAGMARSFSAKPA